MADKGLLFIPDISGFTKFVHENEIEHSRIIIEELLENIINSNQIGLKISEVEGDAILFYRFGNSPSFEEISGQVEKMFCNFQKQLKNYEKTRMCICAACKSAVNLSLKIITHYGEFSSYTVKDFNKLIGKDVIIVHQLLKNDIDLHEYWLDTNTSSAGQENNQVFPLWMQWQHGIKQTENGNIDFTYCMLTHLKQKVEADPPEDKTIGRQKIKVLSAEKTIDTDLVTVLSVMGNLSLRNKWQDGVIKVDNINHPIYHVGIKFRVVTKQGSTVFYSSSFEDMGDAFCLSETDEHKTQSLFVTLKAIAENKTLVVFDLYLPDKFINRVAFPFLFKKKLANSFNTSLNNLAALLASGKINSISTAST